MLCLARSFILDKHFFYYAFGNTPPEYVLHGSAADVLLLACGDLRAVLYSLARDARNRRAVRFTVNDFDEHVIARNVVLLWLAHHADAEHVMAIWFSLGLTAAASAVLVEALRVLTGDDADVHLKEIGVSFHTPADAARVRSVLQAWGSWQLSWQEVQAHRRDTLRRHLQKEDFRKHGEMHGSTHLMQASMQESGMQTNRIFSAAAKEFGDYYVEGVLAPQSAEQATVVNPTLLKSNNAYDLHYGSVPFLAFPLYSAKYSKDRPLATLCLSELTSWVSELKQRKGTVSWTFAVGDCLELCAQLPCTYDVVSTSNVSDHVGLLALLQACRLVTRPRGHLLTSTLLHLSVATHTDEYLYAVLMMEPEKWPGVLGWRCLGHEGRLAPQSSQMTFAMPDMISMVNKELGRAKHGKVRSEANFVWTPAAQSNLPLQLDEAVKPLVDTCRLKLETIGVQPPDLRDGMNRLHLPVLQPILLAGIGAESLLSPDDVEMVGLLAHLRGETELLVASMPLRDQAVLDCVEPQPHLCIVLVTTDKRMLIYSALWVEGGVGGSRRVCWRITPEMLTVVAGVMLLSFVSVLEEFVPVSAIRTTVCPVAAEEGGSALQRLRCADPVAQLHGGRSEKNDEWQVILGISDAWWTHLEAGASLDSRAVNVPEQEEFAVLVGVKGHADTFVKLTFPSPVAASGQRLLLSRKRRVVTLVAKKAPYDFGSRVAGADLWLDDAVAWHRWAPSESMRAFMVSVSGLQMSQEEKFQSRTWQQKDIPPLTALKDTAMYFFQKPDDVAFGLCVGEATHGVIIHHGIRREHRTGIPAADISICFLNADGSTNDVVYWFQREIAHPNLSNIVCNPAEYELLKMYVAMFTARAKDASSWATKPASNPVPKELRSHFVRLLFPPLFAHQKVTAQSVEANIAARKHDVSIEEHMQQLKDKGAALVREKRHAEAVQHYQSAVVRFVTSKEESTAATERLAALCYLNLALCLLEPADATKAAKVPEICDKALELLKESDGALRAKARYRKALALELQGDAEGAKKELSGALSITPEDGVIQKALARLSGGTQSTKADATAADGAESFRGAGNQQFAAGQFAAALLSYRAALACADAPCGLARAKLLSNVAAACMHLRQPVDALLAAEEAVAEDASWWRGHQRAGDALVALFCFFEAHAVYVRAAAAAPTAELRSGVESSREACAARLYTNPAPNFKVFSLLQKTRPALPENTRCCMVVEGAWEATGLAKLVRDEPRTNVLHTTLLQALRFTHPGIAIRPSEGVSVFAPRELGHVYPPSATSFTTDLTRFEAYTPMGYCFEICCGFLAALQHISPQSGWVCYVVGAPMDAGHALLHSTTHNIVIDPLQLGKDPSGVANRWGAVCHQFPQWSVFESPAQLLEWVGEYRAGDKGIPNTCHVSAPGAPLQHVQACKGCRRMSEVRVVPNPAYEYYAQQQQQQQQQGADINDQD